MAVKKRDPKSHPPKSPTRTVRCDTSGVVPALQARLKGGRENPVRVSSGGKGEWPAECPVRIDVEMVLGKFRHDTAGDAEGLMGHIIDMDFYTKQSRVKIKLARDPNAIVIEVNEAEVYRWVESEEDLPHKFFDVIEDMNAKAAKWIDQVDLRPGDEVIEDADGGIIIIREDGTIEEVDDEDEEVAKSVDPIIEDDPIIEEEDEVDWE